jgi:hypothetical protein
MWWKTPTIAFLPFMLFACASAGPTTQPRERPGLLALSKETKFVPHGLYTGADTPEDQQRLQTMVDGAIADISALPEPLVPAVVRRRLTALLDDADLFATEDRDEVGRYAVRIWRAAGFIEDSGLFPVGDDKALAEP